MVIILALAAVSGLIVIVGLEKTIGLRVTEPEELAGLDVTYWSALPSPYEDGQAAAPVTLSDDGVTVGARTGH